MANALGELFGDIAAAIREKTGDTATMKPIEFPEKIAGIETGGGESGVKIFTGSFTATSSTTTKYNVDFGFVPDFLLVTMSAYAQTFEYGMFAAWGISSKLQSATGSNFGSQRFHSNGSKFYTYSHGTFDSDSTSEPLYGVDATGFYTGKELVSGKYYNVLAIGGLA